MQYPAQVQATIDLLETISETGAPADVTANQFFRRRRYIGAKDRKAISELTYKLLRNRDKLEWWVQKLQMSQSSYRTHVLFGLIFFDEIEESNFERIFTGHKYQPEVLSEQEKICIDLIKGQQIDHPDMPEHIRLNLPAWSHNKLRHVFKDELEQQLQALNHSAPLDLRVNSLRADREKVLTEFKKLGWNADIMAWSSLGIRLERGKPLTNTNLFQDGYVEAQDEGSQLVALLCDAQPGQAVLDMCAGAGGKSLALAACMKNKGRLLATDVSVFRLSKAKERLRKAGVSNHEVRLLDSQGQQWLHRQNDRFDRVLVDVPCSGSGTWRRNPDLKWRFKEQDIVELQNRQQMILTTAAPLVKPGGYLVYATCSLYLEENEHQIKHFLDQNQQFTLIPCEKIWQTCINKPYPGGGDMLRLTPFKHGTDGFFVAVMKKD